MRTRADFLVIGGGIAGLRAAIELADRGHTLLVTKAAESESNTGHAQGGIAAAIGADDSPALHLRDTLEAGAGLSDPAAAEVLVGEGPAYVRELIEWGAAFDRMPDGRPALGREAAHSVRRVLHARDATGREIARTLHRRLSDHGEVTFLDHALVTRLREEGGRVIGAELREADGRTIEIDARAVLLATGGAGQVFSQTTNPAIATGDGLAMAWRVGARVADLEFVQFHPTVLDVPGAPRFLVSEAVRGEGARLINADGEAFTLRYDSRGDLAPRDVVATAMVLEAARTGRPAYLSLAHLDAEWARARFPAIAGACASAGLDFARDRLPVSPAAHYMCGGIETDLDGRSSVPGLFAAGEVACTRVHGANRLASNSLLEGLVFGARAARAMADPERQAALPDARETLVESGAPADPEEARREDVPSLMWRHVGLLREGGALARVAARLDGVAGALERRLDQAPAAQEAWRAANLARVGALIARAALRREESRGGHRRTDFPARDDLHWKVHCADRRADVDRG